MHFLPSIEARGDLFLSLCGPRAYFLSKCGPRMNLSLRPLPLTAITSKFYSLKQSCNNFSGTVYFCFQLLMLNTFYYFYRQSTLNWLKAVFLNRRDASRYQDLEVFLPGLELFLKLYNSLN